MNLLGIDNDDFCELRVMDDLPFESIVEVLHVIFDGLYESRMSSGTIAMNNGAAALGWIIGPKHQKDLLNSGIRKW